MQAQGRDPDLVLGAEAGGGVGDEVGPELLQGGAVGERQVGGDLVLAAGQADNSNDRGARVRPGLVPAPRDEAVTHPDAARSTRNVEGISVL